MLALGLGAGLDGAGTPRSTPTTSAATGECSVFESVSRIHVRCPFGLATKLPFPSWRSLRHFRVIGVSWRT